MWHCDFPTESPMLNSFQVRNSNYFSISSFGLVRSEIEKRIQLLRAMFSERKKIYFWIPLRYTNYCIIHASQHNCVWGTCITHHNYILKWRSSSKFLIFLSRKRQSRTMFCETYKWMPNTALIKSHYSWSNWEDLSNLQVQVVPR